MSFYVQMEKTHETRIYVGMTITLSFFYKLILVCCRQLKYKEYLT